MSYDMGLSNITATTCPMSGDNMHSRHIASIKYQHTKTHVMICNSKQSTKSLFMYHPQHLILYNTFHNDIATSYKHSAKLLYAWLSTLDACIMS